MGLDMYLERDIFIGAQFEHRRVTGTVNLFADGKPIKIDQAKLSKVTEQVGYWRKANAIHAWFVKNVQDGEDECQRSYVSQEQLKALRDECVQALAANDPGNLKPQSGFFFGSTEVDEYYWNSLKDTVTMLDGLDPNGAYYYQASW